MAIIAPPPQRIAVAEGGGDIYLGLAYFSPTFLGKGWRLSLWWVWRPGHGLGSLLDWSDFSMSSLGDR